MPGRLQNICKRKKKGKRREKGKKRIKQGREGGRNEEGREEGRKQGRNELKKRKRIIFIWSELPHLAAECFNDVLVSHQVDPPSNLPLNIDSAPLNNHPGSWGS